MAGARARLRAPYTPAPALVPPSLISSIVPPTLVTPTGDVATAVASIINQANKYTLNTWVPAMFAGTGAITSFGGTSENYIRPPACAALALGISARAGVHDATATGATSAASRTVAARLVTGLAATHIANGGSWGGPAGVAPSNASGGTGWQEAMWAGLTLLAGWMIWDFLTDVTKTQLINMGTLEANRMVGWTPPYWKNRSGMEVYSGDSKSEELAWDLIILSTMTSMNSANAQTPAWIAAMCKMGIAMFAQPGDLGSSTVVHGATVDAQISGWNINGDGTVVNHGISPYPDYIVSGAGTGLGFMAIATVKGKPLISSMQRNASLLYSSLSAVNFPYPPNVSPGGTIYSPTTYTIYYPAGQDWGPYRLMDKAAMDVMAMVYGWDGGLATSAHTFAMSHLNQVISLQSRSSTGQTYVAAGEDTYPGREQWIGMHAAACLLTLSAGAGTVSNAAPSVITTAYQAVGP